MQSKWEGCGRMRLVLIYTFGIFLPRGGICTEGIRSFMWSPTTASNVE